jgi:hypothetical protein
VVEFDIGRISRSLVGRIYEFAYIAESPPQRQRHFRMLNSSDDLWRSLSTIRAELPALLYVKKPVFNLSGNPLKPVFRGHGPLLKISKLSFKFAYAVFGRSQLDRKAVSDTQSSATIVFCRGGRLLDQTYNGLTDAIRWVPILWNIVPRVRRKENNVFRWILTMSTHGTYSKDV